MDGTCPHSSTIGIVTQPELIAWLPVQHGKERLCSLTRMPTLTTMALEFPTNWVLSSVMGGITNSTALAVDTNVTHMATDCTIDAVNHHSTMPTFGNR
eukprot:4312347-Karenia_brevis.AAC.1